MFEKNKGIDIILHIGDIKNINQRDVIFKEKMDQQNLSKISQIKNSEVLFKIANAISMCNPDQVFINTGSEEDISYIRDLAIKKGEESKLLMKDHTIHFDLKEEQGRIVNQTFYIANEDEHVSSLANKKLRNDALIDIKEKMSDIMKGMVMIVGFYIRGPVGAKASNPALEITSSAYVSHSAEILYRNAFNHFDNEILRLGHFFTNVHSEGLNRPEDLPNARVYMDRSFQTTYSFNCTYAGNTLLLKKGNHRFAVDKAVYENRGNQLSEHMFLTGIEGTNKRITWFSGAAPSGCGKTTTAMAGSHFIGDDLTQMWIDENGIIRSINPECGIFGIVDDVNEDGDPVLMKVLRNEGAEVIWSNVLVDEKGIPHWNGNGQKQPDKGINFQGEWVRGKKDGSGNEIPISHPNARCTIKSISLSNYSKRAEDPQGVETRVITYSGRDSNTMPPVWQAVNSDDGVVIGASIVSESTATEVGVTGVKRAPWANAPFIPGSLGDYMDAQFKFFNNNKINKDYKPVIAGLNYFLTHEARGGSSKKLLGEKRDVKVWLGWLELRVHNEIEAIKTPIGYIPEYNDLKNLFMTKINKEYPKELYDMQFSLYIDNIIARIVLQENAYKKELNIPELLFKIYDRQKNELLSLKEKCGSIVKPDQIKLR